MTEIFPFKPNWADGVELQLSYKTDIFKSRSGREQRRALRNTPRRTVSYSAITIASDMVKFQRLMATKQNADFYLPDWSNSVQTRGIEVGATHFSIREIAPEWLVADATVFLIDPLDDSYTAVTIDTVSAYTVSLTAPVTRTFSVGTVVRLAHTGLLGNVQTTSNTNNVVSLRVTFDVKPGSMRNSENQFFPWQTGGKEVFGYDWNWGEEVSTEYLWPIETVDFGRGVTTNYRPIDFGSAVQRATIIRQHDQIDAVQRFFERQKGQRNLFWMPSGTSDMEPLADIANGATSFTVAGSEVYSLFSGGDPVYCGVAIYTKDGRKVFRKLNSITLSSGNSVLNLNDAVTFAIPRTLVAKVSWLRPARFASDDQTIEFLTSDVAQLQVTTTTVTYGDDPQDYAPLDGAGNWAMDNWGEQSAAVFAALDYAVNVALPFGDVAAMRHDLLDDAVNNELWSALA